MNWKNENKYQFQMQGYQHMPKNFIWKFISSDLNLTVTKHIVILCWIHAAQKPSLPSFPMFYEKKEETEEISTPDRGILLPIWIW